MYQLTEEGKKYLKQGLPEKNLLKSLPKSMKEISQLPGAIIAVGWAKKNNWIDVNNGVADLTEEGKDALKSKSELEIALSDVNSKGDSELSKILLNRKLIEEVKHKESEIVKNKEGLFQKIFKKKGEEIKEEIKEIAQLTPEILKSGVWKTIPLKNYDINSPVPKIYPGKKQHYIQFIEEIKEKLVGLGFKEMEGPIIETGFWNSDALFMPQDHPGRSLHDAFFLKHPTKGDLPDKNLVAKVKATHEGGWVTESAGWGGEWSEDVAKQLMMRSHTTAVSARTLAQHGDRPGKYFCIGRNYRYDVVDASHLAEFHQCEGIVIGEDLNFGHLLGYMTEFAKLIGATEIKFKPGYFPYTEPSVEGYIKHPKLGWIECLPGGIFRPEVVRPLGIEKCKILAWGIGFDRIAMIKMGINDIRELFTNDLKWSRETPMVR
ncbi:MAG: phenylalanine--tRNA ligase subunit alpha [Nanoarchaeota archaeon]|nr:phenylalanine--tRNA ligase subunit alpha [Nanoarchaeota archaeon]